MWCSSCQQDVPASPDSARGNLDCPRCGEIANQELTSDELLRVAEVSDAGLDLTSLDFVQSGPPLAWNTWELDDEIRKAERITRDEATPSAANEVPAGAWLEPFQRAAQAAQANPIMPPQPVAIQQPPPPAPAKPAGGFSLLAWLTMSLGLVAFTFGAAILVWSRIENRPEFWDLGLGAAIGGQFVLLIGVLLWLERLARAKSAQALAALPAPSPAATVTFPLQPTAWAMPSAIETPSSAFYAHLSAGTHPQRMVADLQGQLDLLAQRIASSRP